jgi:hypothetical protein
LLDLPDIRVRILEIQKKIVKSPAALYRIIEMFLEDYLQGTENGMFKAVSSHIVLLGLNENAAKPVGMELLYSCFYEGNANQLAAKTLGEAVSPLWPQTSLLVAVFG